MDKIRTVEEFKSLVSQCKAAGKNKFSNYFPNPVLHSSWISDGSLSYIMLPEATFFLHDLGTYREIIFFSKNLSDFEVGLYAVRNLIQRPFSVEIVGKNKIPFSKSPSAVLMRMTRTGAPLVKSSSSAVRKANEDDIEAIHEIFSTFFHTVLERTPDKNRLHNLIVSDNISVYVMPDGEIAGIVVYEVSGISIHLRYWWVNPKHRNQGIGSALLSDFFEAGRKTQRQYLWVFSDNENAINRYRHYGFDFDGMTDDILLFE